MGDHRLKTMLVSLDGSTCSFTATTLALDWARQFDARLLGLGIMDEASIHRPEPVPLGAGAYKKAQDEARMADAHRRVAGFVADFRARAAVAGVHAEVLEERGDPAERILFEAQRADVVILGRETHFNFETPERRDATLTQVVRSRPHAPAVRAAGTGRRRAPRRHDRSPGLGRGARDRARRRRLPRGARHHASRAHGGLVRRPRGGPARGGGEPAAAPARPGRASREPAA